MKAELLDLMDLANTGAFSGSNAMRYCLIDLRNKLRTLAATLPDAQAEPFVWCWGNAALAKDQTTATLPQQGESK